MNLAAEIFKGFEIHWGHQKMAASWGGPGMDMAEVLAGWNIQLNRFPDNVVKVAVQSLLDKGEAWPPSLPELVATCKQYNRPEHRAPDSSLLALPNNVQKREIPKLQMNRPRSDKKAWARTHAEKYLSGAHKGRKWANATHRQHVVNCLGTDSHPDARRLLAAMRGEQYVSDQELIDRDKQNHKEIA